ncbi:c-type cytochrome [Hymenobacter canadensis]|uniref:C-type cytochrome n=1 Tax=Hymenobacter canadensis TaxID=2999067 RepID=A0ABY7LWN6_9BACT|nr:c-type cytochrome [Hymenobacter canadensis]WBA43675.1 c-type cytochrome [Hymenobacter canadensis]
MKKAFLLLASGSFLLACGSDNTSTTKAKEDYTLADESAPAQDSTTGANLSAVARQPQVDTSVTKIGTAPTGGAVAVGAKLMEGSDCASCHRENEKLIGPGYREIAAKYPATAANITMLAGKIIKGGKGNWGEIPMTPHPALSQKDAEEMTRYILALK